AVHGLRARPAGRVEPRALAGLASARAPRAPRDPGTGARPQPALSGATGAVGARLRLIGLLVAGAQRRRQQRARLRARRQGHRAPAGVRGQSVARPPLRLTPRPAASCRRGKGGASLGGVEPEPIPWHGQPVSAEVTLPPLAAVWLVPDESPARRRAWLRGPLPLGTPTRRAPHRRSDRRVPRLGPPRGLAVAEALRARAQ